MVAVPTSTPATTTTTTESTSSTRRILIVSTWRSGSSFLGELIASSPGVFYSFEPMAKHVPFLFRCHFPDDYIRFINGTNHVKLNRRIYDECQYYKRPSLCHQPQMLAQLCVSFPVNLIKAVELSVKDLIAFTTNSSSALAGDPVTDRWKIIYLVRDPRGTMASRAKLKWCMANRNCREPARLCSRIEEDLDLLEKHFKAGRDYLLLKFEDLAINVQSETAKLFRFLQLPVTNLTTAFLDTHTQSNNQTAEKDPFSTVRKSDAVAFGWKRKLSPKQIANITESCAPLLKKMGVIV
jgi:carbohydrate 6-sulfotransferase 6